MYNGQCFQDYFVLKCLNYKRNGYFIEIGSNDPKLINNTYILEKEYNWKGLLVEYDKDFLPKYIEERLNSIAIIDDARNIDYYNVLTENNFPNNIDYLQIDLEVSNNSTLQTLELLDKQIFNKYTFGVITFEHDIYTGNHFNTRKISRNIFKRNGYILLFPDVKNGSNPFEDWYVHPNIVDTNIINKLKTENSLEWNEIKEILDNLI